MSENISLLFHLLMTRSKHSKTKICNVKHKHAFISNNAVLGTSRWQLTVSERKNAATFIEFTTVRPFIFRGTSFKCFYCTEYHSEAAILLEHTTTHKIENTQEIFQKYITKSKRCIQVDISRLKCRLCEDFFSDLRSVREHLTNRHGTQFYSTSNGMTEYKLELINDKFVCHVCGANFHNFNLLNHHMNSHIGKVVCETCGAAFLNQHLLMRHKDLHLTNFFTCKHCEKSFSKKSKLTYHTDKVHRGKNGNKTKKCPQCPQTFKEHYAKLLHLRKVHGITNTFPCHVCKNIFNTRRAVTEHVTRIHTEKFKCEVCSKCFSVESRLKQHMLGHIGEKNFICPVCKNAYMHNRTLSKHMKSHGPLFMYNCADCGAAFVGKNHFDEHIAHPLKNCHKHRPQNGVIQLS